MKITLGNKKLQRYAEQPRKAVKDLGQTCALNYKPTNVSHPGMMLREKLEEEGMTAAALAAKTGMPLETIESVLDGRLPITSGLAQILESITRIPAKMFIRMQKLYDISEPPVDMAAESPLPYG